MLKNADMKQSKTVQHSFCHSTGKKSQEQHRTKAQIQYQCMQKECSRSNKQKVAQKREIHECRAKANLAYETATFSQQRNCRSKFFKTKKSTNQNIIPRGMLRGSLNLVIYDPVQKQAQTSKVIDLLNSEIFIFNIF